MSGPVCMTVDVEDFYAGMAALGHDVARPPGPAPGSPRCSTGWSPRPRSPR